MSGQLLPLLLIPAKLAFISAPILLATAGPCDIVSCPLPLSLSLTVNSQSGRACLPRPSSSPCRTLLTAAAADPSARPATASALVTAARCCSGSGSDPASAACGRPTAAASGPPWLQLPPPAVPAVWATTPALRAATAAVRSATTSGRGPAWRPASPPVPVLPAAAVLRTTPAAAAPRRYRC